MKNDKLLFSQEIWRKVPEVAAMLPLDKKRVTLIFLDREQKGMFDTYQETMNLMFVYQGENYERYSEQEYYLRSAQETDYKEFLEEIKKEGIQIGNILFLWHYNGQKLTKKNMECSIQQEVFLLIKAFYTTKVKMPERILFAGSEQGMNSLFNQSLEGIIGTISLLFPNTSASYISQEAVKEQAAEQLIYELGTEKRNIYPVVRYSGKNRMVQAFKEWKPVKKEKRRLKKNGTYLLIGGMGGIGMVLAEYLAKTYHAGLILTGRRVENEEIREKLERLRQLGAAPEYQTVDLVREESIKRFVQTIEERQQHIDGIFHMAGVVSQKMIFQKNKEEFQENISSKVMGTVLLDQMTSDWEIDFFFAFSSTSSVIGDFGQGDYAIANRFLELYMQEREKLVLSGKRQGVSRVVNWPLWESGGMHLKRKGEQLYLQSSGMCYLSNQDGLEALETILNGDAVSITVLAGERERMLSLLKITSDTAKEGCEKQVESRNEISVLEKLEQSIQAIAAEVLEAESSQLDVEDNIGDFGFDSISLKDFADNIGEQFGIEVSPTVFFAKSTIRELSEFLLEEYKTEVEAVYAQGEEEIEQKLEEEKIEKPENSVKTERFIPLSQKYNEKPNVSKSRPDKKTKVAIVGMSFKLPGADTKDELWDVLVHQKDCIDEIPKERWDWRKYYCKDNQEDNKTNSRWGGFIQDYDKFDARFFKISAREAELMDPQHRLYIQAVWSAIEDSGHKISELAGKKVGVFSGIQFTDYQQLLSEHMDKIYAQSSIGNAPALLSNRVSFLFDFMGPSESIDTACSSSLVAIHRAVKSIQRGESEMAIAGGVSLMLDPNTYVGAGVMGFFSPDGRCRTFDQSANGYVKGEGVGVLVLKPLDKAEADGDPIYGVILGSAENHGGHANSLTAPNPDAQAELIVKAYEDAGVSPSSVRMIETHGTGTELGDPIEIDGLKNAFKRLYKEWGCTNFASKRIGLGALKSNIGHLEPASGVAGVIKLLLCMQHQKLPGNVHFHELNPYIKLEDSPFYVLEQEEDWNTRELEKTPICASVSSFGFGGTNAHVVIQEYPNEKAAKTQSKGKEVILLSAKTRQALRQYAKTLAAWITEEVELSETAATLQIGREEMKERLAIVAESVKELQEKLEQFIDEKIVDGVYVQTADTKVDVMQAKRGREEAIAAAWTKGAAIDWSWYREKNVKRISLPTYPFAKTRYWMPDVKKKEKTETGLHAVIDKNVSNLYEQRFEKLFHGEEFYIADHGNVLPGVVYLEMARVAANLSVGKNIVSRLKNIVWANPIVFTGQPQKIYTGIYPGERGLTFQIYSGDGENKVGHAQGMIELQETKRDSEYLDIDAVMKRCTGGKVEAESYYALLKELGAALESRFRGIQQFYYNQSECITKIGVKEGEEYTLQDFFLHPTLTDGGLQSSVAFAYKTGLADKEILYVPFVLGEIEFYEIEGIPTYAYAVQSEKGGLLFDIQFLREDGKVIAKMKELTIRPIQLDIAEQGSHQAQEENGDMIYLKEEWQESMVSETVPIREKKLLVTGDKEVGLETTFRNFKVTWEKVGNISDRLAAQSADGVIYLLSAMEKETKQTVEQKIYPLMEWAQKLVNTKTEKNIFVFCIYQQERGTFNAAYEALDGFFKTLNMEQDKYLFRLIAIENGQNVETVIKNEIAGTKESFVKYQNQTRMVKRRKELLFQEENNTRLRKGGTYLITGGQGGIGMLLADYLAEKYQAQLVLCGRKKADEEKLGKLKKLGAKVLYVQADLAIRTEVEKILEEAGKEFGQVNGIFHCAGVVKDSIWAKKKLSEISVVLAPKVYGTKNLYDVFTTQTLDFILAFSSTTSVFGNMGQADYAYANGYLDQFVAEYKAVPNSYKKVINWSLWKDGGMQVDIQTERFLSNRFGMTPITIKNGLQTVERVLSSEETQVLAIQGRKQKIIQQFVMKQAVQKKEREISKEGQKENNKELLKLLENDLVKIMCDILKAEEYEIRESENIADLGFDSITFTELANAINNQFVLEITPALFFDYTTSAAIAGQILKESEDRLREYYKDKLTEKKEAISAEERKETKSEEKASAYRITSHIYDEIEETESNKENKREPIAIIGIDGVMPGSENVEEYWNNLLQKKDLVTKIPEDRWDYKSIYGDTKMDSTKTDIIKGGFMKQINEFDSLFFHISPAEGAKMDPQERIMLETVWHTLEDAGYRKEDLSGSRTAVFIGASNSDYQELLLKDQIPTSMTKTMIPNRISYFFNWNGPSEPVDTACSSSLVAIHRAVHSIWEDQCEYAIAGGINVITSPNLYIAGSGLGMLSKDGKCKTFDAQADGYVRGEGAGAILLKPLSKAIADKDNIYAVIKGTAVNHGGKANSISAPNAAAQADVIIRANEIANVDPTTITYIETHGTGTSLGDPIEIEGIKKAFGELYRRWNKTEKQKIHCILGCVKTNIGHLEPASGMASMIKVLMAMKYGKIPANIHFNTLNPYIKMEDTELVLPQDTIEWKRKKDAYGREIPRRAGISSFGVGGSNAHIIIEEYKLPCYNCVEKSRNIVSISEKTKNSVEKSRNIVSISAKTKDSVQKYCQQLLSFLEKHNTEKESFLAGAEECLRNDLKNIWDKKTQLVDIAWNEYFYEYGVDAVTLIEFMEQIKTFYKLNEDLPVGEFRNLKSIEQFLLRYDRAAIEAYYGKDRSVMQMEKSDGCDITFTQLSYMFQMRREAMNERVAFVVSSMEELKEKLRVFLQTKTVGNGIYIGSHTGKPSELYLLMKGKDGEAFIRHLVENKDFDKIARFWVEGLSIPWKMLYKEEPYKISIPTYCFERDICWLPSNGENRLNDKTTEQRTEGQEDIIESRNDLPEKMVLDDEDEIMQLLKNLSTGKISSETVDLLVEDINL